MLDHEKSAREADGLDGPQPAGTAMRHGAAGDESIQGGGDR